MLNRCKKTTRIFFIAAMLAAGLASGMSKEGFGAGTDLPGTFHGLQPDILEIPSANIHKAESGTGLASAMAQGENDLVYSKRLRENTPYWMLSPAGGNSRPGSSRILDLKI